MSQNTNSLHTSLSSKHYSLMYIPHQGDWGSQAGSPLPQPCQGPGRHTAHCTLHTTHYTLHTTHYTLHATRYTLHATRYTLHATRYTLHTTIYTLQFTYYNLHTTIYTLQFTHYTPQFTQYTLHTTQNSKFKTHAEPMIPCFWHRGQSGSRAPVMTASGHTSLDGLNRFQKTEVIPG